MNSTLQKIPGIGDIPILGLLFKSKAANKDQTELVVMITPQILPRQSSGVTGSLPRTPEPFLEPLPDKKTVAPLPPAFTPARSSATGPVRSGDDGSAAGAAAIVKGLNAPGPHVTVQPQGPAPAASQTTAQDAAPPSGDKAKHEQVDRKAQKAEQEQKAKQAKLDREQAKRDAEAAKVAAEQAKHQAKKDAEAAKAAAEQAKRQAEIERSHQKALDEAEARMRSAEAAYQAQLGKKE
jgi:hypothetical protein